MFYLLEKGTKKKNRKPHWVCLQKMPEVGKRGGEKGKVGNLVLAS